MSHLERLGAPCQAAGCSRWGDHEVKNDENASLGFFCKRHADKRLKTFRLRYGGEVNNQTNQTKE